MEQTESTRIKRLNKLGQMEQNLVESGELIEEIEGHEVNDQLPLMLFVVIGLALTVIIWISIIFIGIGDSTVQTILGTHFMK